MRFGDALRRSGLVLCATASLSVAGCGSSDDGGEDAGFGGPPAIQDVLPLVAVSSGYVYVLGEHLATESGEFAEVRVRIDGKDAGGAESRVEMPIFEGRAEQLTVSVPSDMHTRIVGAGTLTVETPEGTATFPSPLFAVEDTGFGGTTKPGHGLLGTVYALEAGTPQLPNFADPCNDPSVVSDSTTTCPYTSLLVPNLDVPARNFSAGFPGLGENLVEWFAIRFQGFLVVEEAGSYTFETCSDDGSNLYVQKGTAMEKVVSNDGTHGMACASGAVDLDRGTWPLVVDYFQGPAYQIGLQVSWTKPDGTKEIIPADHLRLFAATP